MQQPWQQPAQWVQQTSADSAATVASEFDEAGAQQVVDAQGLAGRGASGELAAQLLVVQDQPVAVVGDLELVARLDVGCAGKVAADPRGQAYAGVGSYGELRPVQRAEGGVFPVQEGSAECSGRCPPP